MTLYIHIRLAVLIVTVAIQCLCLNKIRLAGHAFVD